MTKRITCPFCGSDIRIDIFRGEPEGISCTNFNCGADWDTNGNHNWGPFAAT